MVTHANSLICIFMNINFNHHKKLKTIKQILKHGENNKTPQVN